MHEVIDPAKLMAGRKVQVHVYGDDGVRDAEVVEVDRVPKMGMIAYTLHVFTLRYADGTTAEVTNHQAMFFTPEYQVTEWCEVCRRRREVEEYDEVSRYSGHVELGSRVARLACGHVMDGPERVVGPSPGGGSAAEALENAARVERQRQHDLLEERYG